MLKNNIANNPEIGIRFSQRGGGEISFSLTMYICSFFPKKMEPSHHFSSGKLGHGKVNVGKL